MGTNPLTIILFYTNFMKKKKLKNKTIVMSPIYRSSRAPRIIFRSLLSTLSDFPKDTWVEKKDNFLTIFLKNFHGQY